jgi:hypothetical protein
MRTNETSLWLKRIALLLLFSISTSTALSAQMPAEATPKLERTLIPATSVLLATAFVQAQPTVRQSDSLLNGALIGAGVGVASALFVCTRMEPWRNCRDDVGPMLRIGALGAAIGAGIDAVFRKRTSLSPGSTALHASPIVARDAGGLQLSLSF